MCSQLIRWHTIGYCNYCITLAPSFSGNKYVLIVFFPCVSSLRELNIRFSPIDLLWCLLLPVRCLRVRERRNEWNEVDRPRQNPVMSLPLFLFIRFCCQLCFKVSLSLQFGRSVHTHTHTWTTELIAPACATLFDCLNSILMILSSLIHGGLGFMIQSNWYYRGLACPVCITPSICPRGQYHWQDTHTHDCVTYCVVLFAWSWARKKL